jgi:hypothetical protein
MTALPSNLALVGEDLARATSRDARRSLRRRRAVTLVLVVAALVVTATAAVANGWLFSETPTVQAVPSLGSADGATPRTLLTGLGPEQRTLTAVTTTSGGVCLTLTGFSEQCVPTFRHGEKVTWVLAPSGTGTTLIWGIVRDEVLAVEAVSSDGQSSSAALANDAFYVELPGSPGHLVIQLAGGGSEDVPLIPCPPTTPDCNR